MSKGDRLVVLGVFLAILLSSLSYASILINEIMYNPTGTDSKHEWIEIYNNESNGQNNNQGFAINLSGYKLFENNIKHSLTLVNGSFSVSDFAVIADDAATFLKDYPDFNGTLLDSVFSLSNTEETIAILDDTNVVVDNMTYNDSLGADNNGRTLTRLNNSNLFIEGVVTKGTPGKQNIGIQETITQDLALEAYIADNINLNIEQTKLFRVVNKNPNAGKVNNITVKYNLSLSGTGQITKEDVFIKDEISRYSSSNTGNFIPTSTGTYLLCGYILNSSIADNNPANDFACKNFTVIDTSNIACNVSINISAEKILYQNDEKIKYDLILSDESYPFTINYGVFDLLGDEIKKLQNTTNTNTKTFTPDIDEIDRILLIKAELVSLACSDNEVSDNRAEIMLLVNGTVITAAKAKKKGSGNESNITIVDVSPDKIKFGQLVKVKLNIYKGDTAKTAVSAYIIDNKDKTKISRTASSMNLHEKQAFYEMTVPILLKDNCDDDFEDGSYKLVIEGLGIITKKDINIAGITGNVCDNSVTKLKLDENGNLDDADEDSDESSILSTSSRKKIEYKITDFPKVAAAGDKIISKVKVINNDNIAHDFSVYSYVALGRKSVSGKIKANMKNITLNARESKELEMVNLINKDIAAVEYKIRVNFKKDNVKTLNSLIETLVITEKIDDDALNDIEEDDPEDVAEESEYELLSKEGAQAQLIADSKKKSLEAKSSKTIVSEEIDDADEIALIDEDSIDEYISTSERAKRLLPTLVIIVLILIEVAVIIKKD
ncbi:lamin tail domain-containing protein [Candidatus Woesearchaeota archaeon]|nr:lamin tail domain-containing protein [Candidatus Woesearchaeota archaeon]